jgi:hypothetical protein
MMVARHTIIRVGMASPTQTSAIKIAIAGWRDALRAITKMKSVAGPAFLLTILSQAAYQLSLGQSFAIDAAALQALWISQSLVLTPLAIAVLRCVLLEETTEHYALNLADRRFQRFFGVAVAIQLLWLSMWIWPILGHFAFDMPIVRGGPITPKARENIFWIFLVVFAVLVSCFVFTRVILSIAILFPAVATDAPGAGWRNAREDSKGHIYRIFCAFALGFVPMLPLDAVDEFVLVPQVGSHPASQIIGVVLRAVKSVLVVSAFASIASTFYVAFGRRLNGVAPVA